MKTSGIKIGVTINLKSVNESLWTNGMKLNIFTFIKLLNKSKLNYEVSLLNTDKIDISNIPPHLREVNFDLLENKYEDLDLLVSMGAQVLPKIIKYLNEKGSKVINYKCGNNYVLSLEKMLFKESPKNYPIHDKGIDEVWYVPQQHETNQGFFRTLYRCNSLPVPFIWDNEKLKQSLDSIDEGFLKDKYKKDTKYDLNKDKRTIGVMEPNLNIVKFSLIPTLIAEECYRGDIGKEKIDRLMITNSNKTTNHKEFMGIIR